MWLLICNAFFPSFWKMILSDIDTYYWIVIQDQGFQRNNQGDNREKVNLIRDKFEYDRERRMREKGM